jgi:hypothetical protein
MQRTATALACPILAIGLALGLLSGCNGNDNSAKKAAHSSSPAPKSAAKSPASGKAAGAGTTYCKLLQTDFTSLFSSIHSPQDAQQAVQLLQRVAAAAPPSMKKDWSVLGGALGQLRGALVQAAKLQQEQKAGKISKKQLKVKTSMLLQQTQSLQTPKTQAAGRAVVANASSYCGVRLGG